MLFYKCLKISLINFLNLPRTGAKCLFRPDSLINYEILTMNRFFIKYISLLIIVMAMLNCRQQVEDIHRPNIIVVMSDDHGYQAISSYSNKLIQTPNIDRIANEGVLFTNAFVCNSICGPSRASILTGKYSHINGFRSNRDRFDGSQQTFPKLLQANGYKTAIFGKWHLRSDPTGFDYWNILPGQGHYYNPGFIKMGKDTVYDGYITDITTDLALDWMDRNNPEKSGDPFCLMIHHKAPHRNWMPPLKYLNEFNDHEFKIPDNFFDDYEKRVALSLNEITVHNHFNILFDAKVPCEECLRDSIDLNFKRKWNNVFSRLSSTQKEKWEKAFQKEYNSFDYSSMSKEELSIWKYQRYMEDYLRCVKSLDDNIGRVLQYLDKNDLADNTIIIYTSDQGFFLGEHGLYDKRFMYEEAMRTPMLIRYPLLIKSGKKVEDLVMNIDIAPTLLDFAGIEIPTDIQGTSMKSLVNRDHSYEWRKEVYYHYYELSYGLSKHYGIRTARYKLIHFYDPIDTWELYDLREDPMEMENIINNQEYKDVLKKMKNRLADKQKELNDTFNIRVQSKKVTSKNNDLISFLIVHK